MILLRTLGGLSVERERGTRLRLPRPRAIAVLIVVAAAGERGISRDRLTALLWPDADAQRGRHSLNQWLHVLRAAFNEDVLVHDGPMIRVDRDVLWTDIDAFAEAVAAGD